MPIQINSSNTAGRKQFALFNLGFRPFFLGAGFFAVISIALWMFIYTSYVSIDTQNISLSQWHAHEMLYGFTMAVVSGFLLTAVKNWTGIPTLQGRWLMILFASWGVARVLLLFGTLFLAWAALADLMFGFFLLIAIARPIIQSKQWTQLAVVSKVALLWIGNLVFYLGCFGVVRNGMTFAINGAVLLFISLILMIGRRVIPFFIERGVKPKVQLRQFKWLDVSILVTFIALFLNTIFAQLPYLTLLFSWILFALNGYRLMNWYASGIWQVPLLWSLYLSAWIINIGFFCYGMQAEYISLSILTLHIFTVGGIGLMTLSMMSRVALGHTGRDIRNPSVLMAYAFVTMLLSIAFRSFIPMGIFQQYNSWVIIAAVFWIIGFSLFIYIYAPILLKPRADGALG